MNCKVKQKTCSSSCRYMFILLYRARVGGVPHHVQVACVLFNLVGVKVPAIGMHVRGHLLYAVDPLAWKHGDLTTHTTVKNEEAGPHKGRPRIRQKEHWLTHPDERETWKGPSTYKLATAARLSARQANNTAEMVKPFPIRLFPCICIEVMLEVSVTTTNDDDEKKNTAIRWKRKIIIMLFPLVGVREACRSLSFSF